MLTNRNGCTVWEKTIINRAPAYIRHVEGELYCESVLLQKLDSDGRIRTNGGTTLFIIPQDSVSYLPKRDDKILDSISDEEQPPKTALTVMQVQDWRTVGSNHVRHVEVTAE